MNIIDRVHIYTPLYRLFFGTLALAAVITQLVSGLSRDSFSPVNFFSFFTIESNIFAATVFIVTALLSIFRRKSDHLDTMRGAAMVCMTITGVIYMLLLSGLEDSLQTPIPWINLVLHYIMPLVVFLDWFVARPVRRVGISQAALWLLFPAIYVAYSLIRGSFVNWYPYPFLNVLMHGRKDVAFMVVIMAVLIVVSVALLVWVTNLGTGKRPYKR